MILPLNFQIKICLRGGLHLAEQLQHELIRAGLVAHTPQHNAVGQHRHRQGLHVIGDDILPPVDGGPYLAGTHQRQQRTGRRAEADLFRIARFFTDRSDIALNPAQLPRHWQALTCCVSFLAKDSSKRRP